MVQIFVQNLRPNVQAAYKLSVLDSKSTINKIMAMHRNDVFFAGNNAPSSKQMMQYVQQQGGQNNNKNRDNPKRGNCHKCGAAGHWAKECKSGRRRRNKSNNQNQQQAATSFPALPAPQATTSFPALPAPPTQAAYTPTYYNQA